MNISNFQDLNKRGIYGIISYDGIMVFYSENMLDNLSKQLRTNKKLKTSSGDVTILLAANEFENLKEEYEKVCSKLKQEGWNILNYVPVYTAKLVKEVIETEGGYKIRIVLKDSRYKVQDVIGIFDNDKEYQLFYNVINKLDSPNSIRAYNKATRDYYEDF